MTHGGARAAQGSPDPAIYPCVITHARTRPVRRSFTYRSYLWLADLDNLPQLPAPLRPLARFEVRDHLGDPAASSIKANVAGYLARNGIDLPALFAVLTAHLPELVPRPLQRLRRLYIPGRRPEQEGTAEASRRNIESHYDLSNDFFELFLDPTLTYSSAFFGPGDTLAQAQGRKIDRMWRRWWQRRRAWSW